MDPITGQIVYAPDKGVQGDEAIQCVLPWTGVTEWMVILSVYSLYPLTSLTPLPNQVGGVTVLDESNSAPVEYGFTTGMGPRR